MFVLLAVSWQLSTVNLESLIIPTFDETVGGLYEIAFVSRELWGPLLISNQALVIGYLISVVVAVPLGLGMARWKRLEGFVEPYIHMILAMPTAPLVPLVM